MLPRTHVVCTTFTLICARFTAHWRSRCHCRILRGSHLPVGPYHVWVVVTARLRVTLRGLLITGSHTPCAFAHAAARGTVATDAHCGCTRLPSRLTLHATRLRDYGYPARCLSPFTLPGCTTGYYACNTYVCCGLLRAPVAFTVLYATIRTFTFPVTYTPTFYRWFGIPLVILRVVYYTHLFTHTVARYYVWTFAGSTLPVAHTLPFARGSDADFTVAHSTRDVATHTHLVCTHLVVTYGLTVGSPLPAPCSYSLTPHCLRAAYG